MVTESPPYLGYVLASYKRRCFTRIKFMFFMSFIYVTDSSKQFVENIIKYYLKILLINIYNLKYKRF